MADQRDEATLAAHLRAQHAKAADGVAEGDALDEAREAVQLGVGAALMGQRGRRIDGLVRIRRPFATASVRMLPEIRGSLHCRLGFFVQPHRALDGHPHSAIRGSHLHVSLHKTA